MGDTLIRTKGYNGFSFSDISAELGIKNASIHYHYPTKTNLGVTVVQEHRDRLKGLMAKFSGHGPKDKLFAFFGIYDRIKERGEICIVGSLASDLLTLDEEVQDELTLLSGEILTWVSEFLEEGRTNGEFHFECTARTKAIMIITNMLAAVQLTRLTSTKDFEAIKETIVNELTQRRQ